VESAAVLPRIRASARTDGRSRELQLVLFLVGLAIVFARKPDALLNPQFFAEDGKIWFGQAYNGGWLATLFLPYAGYLQTLPRLAAGLAVLVPFRFAPLLMNALGAVIQVLPANVLLSARCARWASMRARIIMAAVYLALPNAREVHITITNAQWHWALLACLLVFSTVPARAWHRAFDAVVTLLCGLTGPFCFVLAPLGFVFYRKRRERWPLVLTGLLLLCSVIQILVLRQSAGNRFHDPLGASPQLFIRILGGDVYLGSLFGHWAPLNLHLVFYAAVAVIATIPLVYFFLKASFEFKLFLVFSAAIFLASLRTPITAQHIEPQWWHLRVSTGSRYWFFPTLAFTWSLVWCAVSARARQLQMAACGALAALCIGVVADWRYPAYTDLNFPKYAQEFAAAAPGAAITIPLNPHFVPTPWAVRLVKKK
jgi:hypothetical protein